MKNVLILLLLLLVGGSVSCAAPRRGVLVMAHGGDADWNTTVESTVAPLRAEMPVEIAYGMADPSTMEDAVAKLEGRGVSDIAVVRMFLSGESFQEETEYILGMRKELSRPVPAAAPAAVATAAPAAAAHGAHGHSMEPPRPIPVHARLFLSREGIAESELVDGILADRVRELSVDPTHESVLLLAHGAGLDEENERVLQAMRARTGSLREIGPFPAVRCETLREDWPEKRTDAERRIRSFVEEETRAGRTVLVVPFRLSGFGPYEQVLDGLSYRAAGKGFCPHENITRWVENAAQRAFVGS